MTRSASRDQGSSVARATFFQWWQERRRSSACATTLVPFSQLDRWSFAPSTGNLIHDSGSFFSVEGLRLHQDDRALHEQPIINQPETGVLGILVKEFGGVLHCLMQAKVEPGNVNTLQLSPTVQATRSNYTRRHRGRATRYLEYFTGQEPTRTLVDVLQSEQGTWFWHKRNRNMVVEALGGVELHDDHHWLPVSEVLALLHVDDLVNMDARTVLSCLPFGAVPSPTAPDPFAASLVRSYTPSTGDGDGPDRHRDAELRSWLIDVQTRLPWVGRLVPLNDVTGWSRGDAQIVDAEERDFRIIAVRVESGSREVARWSQPLLSPRGQGTAVFLTRVFDGALHLLVQARAEPGLRNTVELAPTVQVPAGVDPTPSPMPSHYREVALTPDPARVRFDTVLSEEGGRFYHARTRYRIVETPPDLPTEPPDTHRWMTVRQLIELVRHGHYVNIEARSLLACLHSLW